MMTTLAVLLLTACLVVGLVLIPLGLPGLWLMVLGVLGYGWMTDFRTVTLALVVAVVALAIVGEIIEAWVGFRLAKRYGGSNRAGWGALIGGLAGAVIGVPVPVVGSVIGGFLGTFIGAVAFEYTASRHGPTAWGAGWGAVVGRGVAAAMKLALGLVIAVLGVYAALRA